MRQRRDDAIGRLDERDLDVLFRIDLVEPIGHHAANGAVGSPTARLVAPAPMIATWSWPGRTGSDCVCARRQALTRRRLTLRLVRGVEADRVLLDAGRTEIVGDAADRDHQRIVRYLADRGDRAPLVVELGVELHHPARAVEPDHLAVAKAEAVPVGLGEIVELVPRHVHRCRRRPRAATASTDGRAPCRPARPRRDDVARADRRGG